MASQTDDDAATIAPSGRGQETGKLDSKTRPISAADSDWISPDARFGPFRIKRKLGQGGMGSVFEAEHCSTGQSIALKLLSRDLLATEESVERFKRESQIAASINHPRSTFVYEAGQLDNQFYITMELMTGGTLKEVVEEEGQLPVEKAIDYVLDIINGLQVAHEAGIVHRDLKPSNCFIDSYMRRDLLRRRRPSRRPGQDHPDHALAADQPLQRAGSRQHGRDPAGSGDQGPGPASEGRRLRGHR